jgi:putative membrane protein
MIGFFIRVAVVALGLWLATKIVPGVHYTSLTSLALAALLLGVVNAVVRPILVLLTLPVTLVTLGLFLLVINGLMIKLVTVFIHGFIVHGLIAAILCSIVVWVTSLIVSALIGSNGRFEPARR